MEIDLSEYMGAYIDGARENLDIMDKMLLSLEQNPSNLQAVSEIFRAAHTLKGMSATMGFEKIAHLTHEMENILDKLRNQELAVSPLIIDTIFETFDVLRTIVNDSIDQTDSGIDLAEISAKLAACANAPAPAAGQDAAAAPAASAAAAPAAAAPAAAAPAAAAPGAASSVEADLTEMGFTEFERSGLVSASEEGKHVYLLTVSLVADCLLKGPRVFMVLRNLDEEGCDIAKSLPEVKDLENEKFDRSFKMVITTQKTADQIKESINAISEIESVSVVDVFQQAASQPAPAAPAPAPAPAPAAPAPAPAPAAPAPAAPAPAPAAPAPKPAAPTPVHNEMAGQKPVAPPAPKMQAAPRAEEAPDEDKESSGVVQLVTFNLAGETYALGIQQVEAIINMVPIARVPKAPVHIDGVINLRGEIVPVINTRRKLHLKPYAPPKNDKADSKGQEAEQIIILSFDEEKVKAGFLVDSVREVINMPETSIEPPSRVSNGVDIEYLRGVGKIDTKIVILLNAYAIVFGRQQPAE